MLQSAQLFHGIDTQEAKGEEGGARVRCATPNPLLDACAARAKAAAAATISEEVAELAVAARAVDLAVAGTEECP